MEEYELKRLYALQAKLRHFCKKNGVGHNWHEPGNQGVSATVSGEILDNAFASAMPDWSSEIVITLSVWGQPTMRVNLADLLALACL